MSVTAELLQAVDAVLAHGISVLPTGPDKRPKVVSQEGEDPPRHYSWDQWKRRRPTPAQMRDFMSGSARGYGIICGLISGNLETLDHDDYTGAVFEEWKALVIEYGLGDVLAKCYIQRTQSEGHHVVYRCEVPVLGNKELCYREGVCKDGTRGLKCMVETRGEGGYACASPTEGYTVIQGSLLDLPVLTKDQYDTFHALARMLCQKPIEAPRERSSEPAASAPRVRPGDDFNNRADWMADVLAPKGWSSAHRHGDVTYVVRPGKKPSEGISASINYMGLDRLKVFSSNAQPFETDSTYSKFEAYTLLYHGAGNFEGAVKALAAMGYGGQIPRSEEAIREQSTTVGALVEPKMWPQLHELEADGLTAPYPLACLPPLIGDAVQEVVEFVQCPPPLAACSALAALSLVGQGLIDVKRLEGLEGPCSLFVLSLADSGERKTTCDNMFMASIRDWECEQAELARLQVAKYKADYRIWKNKIEGLESRIRSGSGKGSETADGADIEDQLRDLQEAEPVEPRYPQLTYQDINQESIVMKLEKAWPCAGIMSSEGGIVFGGTGMSKDNVMKFFATVNDLWSGQPVKVTRKTTESYHVRDARFTLGIAIQPGTFSTFVSGDRGLTHDTGFMSRCLLAKPATTVGTRMISMERRPNGFPRLAAFNWRLRSLLDEQTVLDEQGKLPRMLLTLSPEASEIWVKFHNDIEAELRIDGEFYDVRDVASKAADNVARLAALFHLFEQGVSGQISEESVQSAAAVVLWHIFESKRFYQEIAVPQSVIDAKKLEVWIRDRGGTATRTEVLQRGPGPVRTRKRLDEALAELVKCGRARAVPGSKPMTIELNPAILEAS